MFIMKNIYETAVNKAKEVIEQLGADISVVDTAKVMLIVEKLTGYNIELYRADFSIVDLDNVGAFTDIKILKDKNEDVKVAEIFINSNKTIQQQRFSLVHELGHLMMGDTLEMSGDSITHENADITLLDEKDVGVDQNKIIEQKANIFALLVLMPQDSLRRSLRTNGTLELSGQYNVTERAVLDRLKVYFSTDMAA